MWTWTAIDADTKLIVSYMIGRRDPACAHEFMLDVADRVTSHVQLTTDGLKAYLTAVENAFGDEVDYAQLIKVYGQEVVGPGRYSPPHVTGVTCNAVIGEPDRKHVSTSFVERQNLTMRMGMRRFTPFDQRFQQEGREPRSCRRDPLHVLQLLPHPPDASRYAPLWLPGLCDHVWEVEEIAALVEAKETAKIAAGGMKRGSYKAKNSKLTHYRNFQMA